MADAETCSNPGCKEPGIHKCSACKTTPYCGPICQTADWPHHREECPGHLRKMGMAYFEKARAFERERNVVQLLRYADLALRKLKPLKDRSLAFIIILDEVLRDKFNSLNFMDRHKEALECATERYNMWATTYMRNPHTIDAAFPLIDSLIKNKEFAQAHLIASTVYDMVMHPTNHDIPGDLQQPYLADAARLFALTIYRLAESGGIPPEEQQKAGEEAIALARKALEIHTQLYGAESEEALGDLGTLANVLSFFVDDDEEAISRYEQLITILNRLEGTSSVSVATFKKNLGSVYGDRADRAYADNDLDHCLANYGLFLSHYREAIRIFRANNLMDRADDAAQRVTEVEGKIWQITVAKAAASSR